MDPSGMLGVSEIIRHKWVLVILAHLDERSRRYMELLRKVQEANMELTEGVFNKNIKQMAAAGLIKREAVSRHHVYALTPLGQHIVDQVAPLTGLSDGNLGPDGNEIADTTLATEHDVTGDKPQADDDHGGGHQASGESPP